MRRILTVALAAVTLLTLAAPAATARGGNQGPACPLTNDHVVELPDHRILDNPAHRTRTDAVTVRLPAGEYRNLTVYTQDSYAKRRNVTQPFEQAVVTVDGHQVGGVTPDLADKVRQADATTVVADRFTLPGGAVELQGRHAFAGGDKPTANSLNVVCVGFDDPQPEACPYTSASYPDVVRRNAHFCPVEWNTDLGFLQGYPDGLYRPSIPQLQRHVELGEQRITGEPFADVIPPGGWPAASREWTAVELVGSTDRAVEIGLFVGVPGDGGNDLQWDDPIRRDQLATVLLRLYEHLNSVDTGIPGGL